MSSTKNAPQWIDFGYAGGSGPRAQQFDRSSLVADEDVVLLPFQQDRVAIESGTMATAEGCHRIDRAFADENLTMDGGLNHRSKMMATSDTTGYTRGRSWGPRSEL